MPVAAWWRQERQAVGRSAWPSGKGGEIQASLLAIDDNGGSGEQNKGGKTGKANQKKKKCR